MMTKIKRGRSAVRLVQYLYGPGRHNEHTDPHLVAGWDPFVPDLGRDTSISAKYLSDLLEAPVTAYTQRRGKPPSRPVWHTIVSNPKEDTILTDAQWQEVAAGMVAAAGLAPPGDDKAVRWIAVRHGLSKKGNDHIHIVATLVRQDGRVAQHHNDATAMRRTAWEFEDKLKLRSTRKDGDRTATARPTRAEQEKAVRKKRPEGITIRQELAETVRRVAVATRTEKEFFAGLEAAGLRVNRRMLPSGDVGGFSVALPGDRTEAGATLFFSGSTLAPDLSLPRLRRRWTRRAGGMEGGSWQSAAADLERAAEAVRGSGNPARVGVFAEQAGDILVALSTRSDPWSTDVRDAARAYERAGRLPGGGGATEVDELILALERVAWVVAVGAMGDSGEGLALVLIALVLLIAAIAWWHAAHGNPAQAAAAGRALDVLRPVGQRAVGRSTRGGARRYPVRGDQAAAARTDFRTAVAGAVPQYARAVLADGAGWPVLAAQLRRLEEGGHDPAAVLAVVARRRGLEDARSVAEVLAWRVERWLAGEWHEGSSRRTPARQNPAPRTRAEAAVATSRPRVPRESSGADADGFVFAARAGLTGLVGDVDAVLADPAWPALAAEMAKVEAGGEDAAAVLAQVAAARELGSADSVAQVLAWRLDGRSSTGSGSTRASAPGTRRGAPGRTPSPQVERGSRPAPQEPGR